MTPSPRICQFIQGYEKLRLDAYYATTAEKKRGIVSIGYGATGPDIRIGMKWTIDQANARFNRDMAKFGAGVLHDLMDAPTNQNQYDALVSLAFNIGEGNFHSSTLLRLHKAGDFTGAHDQFAVWCHQSGKVLDGLVSRRAAEAAIYSEPL